MAELDLPRGPRELFHAVHQPLAEAFGGEEHLRFGGGTALAARWGHRHSVDVDFFVEEEPYRHFHRATGGRFLLDMWTSHPMTRANIDRIATEITFHGRDGHVSIACARGLYGADPRSSDTPRGTAVPLETTAEILTKKLLYRMAQEQTIISQDLYDLAFAQRRDPAALRTTLDAANPEQLRRILVAFDDHTASGHPLTPLIDPSDPQLERDAPAIIHRLIERESLIRPDPGPERGPTFEPSR
ncbi:MAG: nucleotidyl transferase AbiEii/AbiGii toxin family protein [Gemmatimonadota bacterium]|nr:nucleotidyl transferase AbiEii/AbiGii toxin family protein [Gemmatimonadota bacterium]MDE2872954.1 nucleotidyl transferase AbiEii/AbiGii toxin family protein [Gemmatimonadota bacterium]